MSAGGGGVLGGGASRRRPRRPPARARPAAGRQPAVPVAERPRVARRHHARGRRRRGPRLRGQRQGEVVMPPKLSLHGEGDAYSQVMAATLPATAASARSGSRCSRRTSPVGLPITNGLVVLSDPGDRAAVGGHGRRGDHRLANRRERRRRRSLPCASRRAQVGVLGCGVQARAAVRALAAVLPDLREVFCHDAVRGPAGAFAANWASSCPAWRSPTARLPRGRRSAPPWWSRRSP